MVCVSIAGRDIDGIIEIVDGKDVDMAEVRLDLCPISDDDITELFSCTDKPLVATCRAGEKYSKKAALLRLENAINSGSCYADIELEASISVRKRLAGDAYKSGTTLICSYHNYEETPSTEELIRKAQQCLETGDIAKLAVMAHSQEDVDRVKALYTKFAPGQLIAFCMGEEGRRSRIDALSLGAPFSYAALDEAESVAPGQWPYQQMNREVYGEAGRIENDVVAPAAKSFAQRAIIAAALSEGRSTLTGYSPCDDSENAIRVAGLLGAKITREGDRLEIECVGGRELELKSICTGESGLLTRLMIPVLSKICKTPVTVEGQGTLLKRPLKGAAATMAAYGVELHSESEEIRVPVEIRSNMVAGDSEVSGSEGSQLISGLLMSLPLCEKDSTLYVTEPKSIPYLFMTVDVLRNFGIGIKCELEGDEEFMASQDPNKCSAMRFEIKGGQSYKPAEFAIEGDWSGAANFLVAGALYGGVHMSGLDTDSLQADMAIMEVLSMAGASISQEEDGEINLLRTPLLGFEADLNNSPDIFPITALLAAFCTGETRLHGVKRLASKESDRASAIAGMLSQMGVKVRIADDTMTIEGESIQARRISGHLLKGGEYTSHHDHRMAMALKVASLAADGPIVIDDTACEAKSYPGFMEAFDKWASKLA